MTDRNDVIREIEDGLGDGGSRELAERLYDKLRAEDRIQYTDAHGLRLVEGVDLIAEAGALLHDE